MKILTINYLPYNDWRKDYYKLLFYFFNKIKDENKEKIQIHIGTQQGDESLWEERKKELVNIDCEVKGYDRGNHNYLNKITYGSNKGTEFSVKLDEDIIVNNFIWDYMIENMEVLNDDDIMLTSILSNNIPCVDYFVEGIFDDESKKKMYDYYLNTPMPNGLWGANYTTLDKYTIHADEWKIDQYNEGLMDINTNTKGMHPIRISWESEFLMNNFILDNVDVITEERKYSIMKKKVPYFTNSFFFIRTKFWKYIIDNHRNGDIFDEIGVNKYMRENNKNLLVVDNSYSIHTMYNTIQGDKNRWKIGSPEGREEELRFIDKLIEKIIK